MVMVGEFDVIDFQIQADIIDRDIPNSTKIVVPNSGHMSDIEQPAFVSAALLDFFAAHPIFIIPEPSTATVFFVGAMAIAVCRRGRQFLQQR
jgi:hypothetical protein